MSLDASLFRNMADLIGGRPPDHLIVPDTLVIEAPFDFAAVMWSLEEYRAPTSTSGLSIRDRYQLVVFDYATRKGVDVTPHPAWSSFLIKCMRQNMRDEVVSAVRDRMSGIRAKDTPAEISVEDWFGGPAYVHLANLGTTGQFVVLFDRMLMAIVEDQLRARAGRDAPPPPPAHVLRLIVRASDVTSLAINDPDFLYRRGLSWSRAAAGEYDASVADASVTDASVADVLVGLVGAARCAKCGAKPAARESFKRCAGCHGPYYCGARCQRADWSAHKTRCTAVTGACERPKRGIEADALRDAFEVVEMFCRARAGSAVGGFTLQTGDNEERTDVAQWRWARHGADVFDRA